LKSPDPQKLMKEHESHFAFVGLLFLSPSSPRGCIRKGGTVLAAFPDGPAQGSRMSVGAQVGSLADSIWPDSNIRRRSG
jgi:hypothetical protein